MSSIAERLKNHTSSLVDTFRIRASKFREAPALIQLFKPKPKFDEDLATRLLGREGYALGVDGSLDYDERLEMLLFYITASGFKCPYTVKDRVQFDLRAVQQEPKLTVSAAVPLWLEDISELGVGRAETDFDFSTSVQRVPNALMTLGEIWMGLQGIRQQGINLLFLDRPLSGAFAPLSRDVRNLIRKGESNLTHVRLPRNPASLLDIYLAATLGSGRSYVPRRGSFLVPALIQALLQRDEMAKLDFTQEFAVDERGWERLVHRLMKINNAFRNRLFAEVNSSRVVLNPEVKGYWERASATAETVAHRVFESTEHPLQLGHDRWLGVLDLSAVTLILLLALRDQAAQRNKLVIGITKDTAATDFTRAVVPFSKDSGMIDGSTVVPGLKNDKAFLTILSQTNYDPLLTPWRTVAYDSCFTTMSEEGGGMRASRKVVSRERLFVRAYFQLRSFRSDPSTRSPVFLFDRFVYDFDTGFFTQISVVEKWGKSVVEPFFERGDRSVIDDQILHILSQCDNPEILEAFGHNQLLFLADKAVKAEVRAMRATLRSVADLELGTLARRERWFSIIRRYRDLRSESEMARARAVQGV